MPRDRKKRKRKKRNGVPDRWLYYRPVGQRIPGTRFIAFKVPLKPSLNCRVPESDTFGFWDLLDYLESQNQQLGLIIDLTFTKRYYGLTDIPQSCSYIKILTEGRQLPSDAAILSFKRAVRQFLKENQDNDKLIGVHCTHGLNRTGYLVCRYLIDVDEVDAEAALELFNSCRGHCIERQNYLDDLRRGAKRSNGSIDEPEEEAARGLAMERQLQTAGDDKRPSEETLAAHDKAHGNCPRRRARRHQQADQKVCDRLPQGRNNTPPVPRLPPTPPLHAYIWSACNNPSATPTHREHSWNDGLRRTEETTEETTDITDTN